mgnify:CR=1 FL=1
MCLIPSSIAFEFELALFGVVTFWISTFFKRYQIKRSRVRSYVIPSYVVPSYSVFNYSSIDTGEARLFAYEREYGDLLPQRFSNDLLLRSVFFAIMAIEDGNRPEFIRTIERMAAHFHLANTTGIMSAEEQRLLCSDREYALNSQFPILRACGTSSLLNSVVLLRDPGETVCEFSWLLHLRLLDVVADYPQSLCAILWGLLWNEIT